MKLATIMAKPVVCVDTEATLADVIRLMEESGHGFLPVIRDGGVVGVVTGRDIAIKGAGRGMDLSKVHVAQVMSSPVRTVSCDLDAEDAAILMRLHRVRRLVVTGAKGEPVGIVALVDLAGTMADGMVSETLHLFAIPTSARSYETRSEKIPGLYTG